MAKNEKVRLKSEDWTSLFPGQDYQIGSTIIRLKPLAISAIARITNRLAKIGATVDGLNLSVDQFDAELSGTAKTGLTSGIASLAGVILTEAPEILSELSGVHEDDINELPLSLAVDLFTKCLEINIESQEDLVKNLKSLGKKFNQFLNPETKEATPSPAMTKRAPLSVN